MELLTYLGMIGVTCKDCTEDAKCKKRKKKLCSKFKPTWEVDDVNQFPKLVSHRKMAVKGKSTIKLDIHFPSPEEGALLLHFGDTAFLIEREEGHVPTVLVTQLAADEDGNLIPEGEDKRKPVGWRSRSGFPVANYIGYLNRERLEIMQEEEKTVRRTKRRTK